MWHHITRTFISSAVFSVTWFSFLINVLYRSEGWCQKFLPELSSTSVTGLCSALTLFKGCTSSLLSSLGKTPRNCSRWWNASLLMSAEFNQQKASLGLVWGLHVLPSLPEQGMHHLLRISWKFKVQRRSVKCPKPLHSLSSFPSL